MLTVTIVLIGVVVCIAHLVQLRKVNIHQIVKEEIIEESINQRIIIEECINEIRSIREIVERRCSKE